MASELACPKCQSENTKKISQIIRFGTREREVQIGMRHGSVSEIDPLAEEFSIVLKDAVAGHPGGGDNDFVGILLLSVVSGAITFAYQLSKHNHDAGGYGIMVGLCVFIFSYGHREVITNWIKQ